MFIHIIFITYYNYFHTLLRIVVFVFVFHRKIHFLKATVKGYVLDYNSIYNQRPSVPPNMLYS